VQGKSETIDVTMKKSKKKDMNEWRMHPNNHEAIIAPEIFFKVQEEVKKRSDLISENGRPVRHSSTALFSTVVRCKLCGSTCTIKRQKHYRNYSPYYACIAYEQTGKKGCGHERVTIFEEALVQLIQGEIKKLVGTEYKVIRDSFSKMKETKKPKNARSNLKAIEEAIQEKATLSMTLLTSYSKGMLGEAQFKLQNQIIEADLQGYYKEKTALERELSTFVVTIDKEQELIDEINKLSEVDATKWTNAMIKEIIDKITIDNNGNVEVYLKYHLDEKISSSTGGIGNTAVEEVCISATQDYQYKQSGYFNFNRFSGYI
jgi:site-specific DNA recombinase